MLDELRERMASFLIHHRTGVLSVSGEPGAWAMPVRCRLAGDARNRHLAVECLLPRWADGLYYLEQDPRVTLVVRDADAPALRWLQVQGQAQPVRRPDWRRWSLPRCSVSPEELYQVVRVTPRRMDLIDEGRGWGARETLEFAEQGRERR